MLSGINFSSIDATGSKHVIFRSGQYIIFTTRDGNNKLLPVAIAVVEGETAEAYQYFMDHLFKWGGQKYFNLEDSVTISDRCKGLEEVHKALNKAFVMYCFKHIIPNVKKQCDYAKSANKGGLQIFVGNNEKPQSRGGEILGCSAL